MNPIKPSPSSTPRVGGNKYTPGAVQPRPVAAPAQAPAGLNPEFVNQIEQKGQNKFVPKEFYNQSLHASNLRVVYGYYFFSVANQISARSW
jgi:hypothetical protein